MITVNHYMEKDLEEIKNLDYFMRLQIRWNEKFAGLRQNVGFI